MSDLHKLFKERGKLVSEIEGLQAELRGLDRAIKIVRGVERSDVVPFIKEPSKQQRMAGK